MSASRHKSRGGVADEGGGGGAKKRASLSPRGSSAKKRGAPARGVAPVDEQLVEERQEQQQQWAAEAFGVTLKRKPALAASGSKDAKRRKSAGKHQEQEQEQAEEEEEEDGEEAEASAAPAPRSRRRESRGGGGGGSKQVAAEPKPVTTPLAPALATSPSPGRSFGQMMSAAFSAGPSSTQVAGTGAAAALMHSVTKHFTFADNAAAAATPAASPAPRSARKPLPLPSSSRAAPASSAAKSKTPLQLPPPPSSASKLVAAIGSLLPKTPRSFREVREAVAPKSASSGLLLLGLVALIFARLLLAPGPATAPLGAPARLDGRRAFLLAPFDLGGFGSQWVALKTAARESGPGPGPSSDAKARGKAKAQSGEPPSAAASASEGGAAFVDKAAAWGQLTALEAGMAELEAGLGEDEERARALNATRAVAAARLRGVGAATQSVEEQLAAILLGQGQGQGQGQGAEAGPGAGGGAAGARALDGAAALRQALEAHREARPASALDQAEAALLATRQALDSASIGTGTGTGAGAGAGAGAVEEAEEGEGEGEVWTESLDESVRVLQKLNRDSAIKQNKLDRRDKEARRGAAAARRM